MSQENVELVRRGFDVWNSGDMDALREYLHPSVILWPLEDWPEPGPFVGRDVTIRQWEQMRETWDADALEPIGPFIDAGDSVVVRTRWRGSGHGPESRMEFTNLYTLRKGRVFLVEQYWNHAEALEAVGLSE
jgi:ketosteroid isomerase-like protein